MNPVAMSEGFAVHGLHQKQLEIIWRTQILRHTRLTDGFLPEQRAGLPTQPIPALLVIIHDGTEKIPFEFLKGHGSRLGRRFGIVNAVAGVGQAPLKALGHPAKQRFDGTFRRGREDGMIGHNEVRKEIGYHVIVVWDRLVVYAWRRPTRRSTEKAQ